MGIIFPGKGRAFVLDQLTQFTVEVGWSFDPDADPAYELDAVAVLTNSSGHIRNRLDMVVYDSDNTILIDGEEHPCSYDESVIGPARYADDEVAPGVGRDTLLVDLDKTDEKIKTIYFAMCLYWEESNPRDVRRHYHLGNLKGGYIAFKDRVTGKELLRQSLNLGTLNNCKGVELGKLFRRGDEWRYLPTNVGLKNGWDDLLALYANGPLEALDF